MNENLLSFELLDQDQAYFTQVWLTERRFLKEVVLNIH